MLLLITSYNEIPESITHIAHLEKGKLIFADKKENFHSKNLSYTKNKLDTEILNQLKTFKAK